MTQPIVRDTEQQSHPATSVLFITVMIDLIGFGIVLPLLPSYAARFQVSETAIGVVVGSFSLMQFLFAPGWGRLSDRVGRRPVLLVGLAGSCLSYLLFAVAGSFWILLLSRMLAGGMGATVNVAQAYLADVTPAHGRARAMGLIGAAFGLGFVLGPAIAGLTIRWGTRAPGLVAASISLASFTLAWWRLPETRVHQPVETTRFAEDWTRLAGPYCVMFLVILAFTVMTVVFPLYSVRVLGYDQRTTSSFFVLLGVVSALIQGWLLGKLTRRLHERALIVAGGGFLAAGLAMIPLARLSSVPDGLRLPTLIVALICIATGTGLATPSITGLVSRMTPPSRQGVALGTLQSVGSVARIVGPPATGFITQIAGERVPFLAGSAAAFAALILAILSRVDGVDAQS